MNFESDSSNSDTELQKAYAQGKLKPGLNYEAEKDKKYVYNRDELLQSLNNLNLKLPWTERLDLTNDLAVIAPELVLEEKKMDKNVHNDFKQEERFYRQAQAAVLEAIPRLLKHGLPTKRPQDYFAQMAKSDDHMKKVREKLLQKHEALERSEKAKKLRELKKFSKQVQKEVIEKRQKEKKEILSSVKKYRQGHMKNLEFLDNDDDVMTRTSNPKKGGKPTNKRGKFMPNKRRKSKDEKFGQGSQKKRSKYNTAESHAEPFKTQNKRKKFDKNKRPGKVQRNKRKNRKK